MRVRATILLGMLHLFLVSTWQSIHAEDLPGGDELDLFAELPIVISASRQETSIWESSAATSVLDAGIINAGGWQSLEEQLKFLPGMDFLNVDRRRTALGIHGLHDASSNRTLYLIDGMPAHDQLFGLTNFANQPLFLDSVERIEQVRSPGSAAWGANAFHGVVNVITADPGLEAGVAASAQVNHFGDVHSSIKWENQWDRWGWRVQFGYENVRSAVDVLDEDFEEDDGFDSFRLNIDSIYHIDDQRTIRSGIHSINQDYDSVSSAFFQTGEESQVNRYRIFSRYRDQYAENEHLQLQAYLHVSEYDVRNTGPYDALDLGLDAEWQQQLSKQQLTLGANVVVTNVNDSPEYPEHMRIGDGNITESSVGIFAIDKIAVKDDLDLEFQLRADFFSEVDNDFSARASVLKKLDDDDRYLIRAAVAKAYRTPSIGWRESEFFRFYSSPPAPPPFDGAVFAHFEANDDVDNEEIIAFELGFRAHPTEEIHIFVDSYYHDYDNLSTLEQSSVFLAPGLPSLTVMVDEGEGATLFGLDIEAQYRLANLRATLWYSYNDWQPDEDDQNVRAFGPVEHKIGLQAQYLINDDNLVQTSLTWSDVTKVDPYVVATFGGPDELDARTHWDMSYIRSLRHINSDIQVGVLNILDKELESVSSVGTSTAHDLPGRTFYLRYTWSY